MHKHPHFFSSLRRELYDWKLWSSRMVVLGFACLSGLAVVGFTWMSDLALQQFHMIAQRAWWAPLIWTPGVTLAVVWCTRRYAIGASGSGIPQVMAALSTGSASSPLFVSLKLSISKMVLTTVGLLGGLSLGREGPSVQIAAGVLHSASRWLPKRGLVTDHGLIIAGGAAGIAAAFNTPLGGVMFAIEELTRKPEQRSNGLIIAAIVLGGLMAVSVFGNSTYFGIIRVDSVGLPLLLPGLVVTLVSGVAGGLFSRLLILCLSDSPTHWYSRFRQRAPLRFAFICGLLIAVVGIISHGATFGSGYAPTRALLEGTGETSMAYVLLKFIATWLTAWSGVPGGIFAPSLAIGGALGNDVAQLMSHPHASTLIALGMAGFLAAATQAPMTAFVIVMEMVDGHGLVLSLMACALMASGISRLISVPLYSALADIQLLRLPKGSDAPAQAS